MEDTGIVENFEEYVEVQDSQIGYKSKAGCKKPMHHHDYVQVLVPMEGAKWALKLFERLFQKKYDLRLTVLRSPLS